MSSKITGWLMAKMRNGTAEVPIPTSRETAIKGLVRSKELPWSELKAQGWTPLEFILKPVNNNAKKTKRNPPLLQAGVLTQSEEERMELAKKKIELWNQTGKALVVKTGLVICIISIFNVAHAFASPSKEGFFCTERPWNCEYTRDVVRESVRTPVIRKYNRPGGRRRIARTVPFPGQEIIVGCGSKLISGYRPHAHVAGTNHPSLHSTYPARAADIRGNPSCAYALLRGWPGGFSVDYNRVKHIHLSYSPPGSGYLAGREWHTRFVHGGGHKYAHVRHRQHLRG